jgi:hypothetical protein
MPRFWVLEGKETRNSYLIILAPFLSAFICQATESNVFREHKDIISLRSWSNIFGAVLFLDRLLYRGKPFPPVESSYSLR